MNRYKHRSKIREFFSNEGFRTKNPRSDLERTDQILARSISSSLFFIPNPTAFSYGAYMKEWTDWIDRRISKTHLKRAQKERPGLKREKEEQVTIL
ncbi:hypothetical protein MRB53_000900 [Persea americana]|uniref:Uncharacterized protein n=1 Tax=Persea americana TaxID=3435 RepID=A0ACC2MQ39_PERAE|nr:hypothetical protein MRB53_000900 [Persea americana]